MEDERDEKSEETAFDPRANDPEDANALRAFYDAYSDALNRIRREMFDEDLGEVAFVIQGGRATRPNTKGVFIPKRWTVAGKEVHEISLTAEALSKDPLEVLGTITHEMVHWSALVNGDKDVVGRHMHTDEFRDRAKKHGYLVKQRDPKHGWTHGEPSPELEAVFNACIEEYGLNRFSGGLVRNAPAAPAKKRVRKVFKYRCPACKNVARTGLSVPIICGRDNKRYEFDDQEPEQEELAAAGQSVPPPDFGDNQ